MTPIPSLPVRISASVALALACVAPAAAQGFPPLRVGQAVQGTLSEADPSFVERGRFRAYRFDATADQTYVLTLRAESFDAFLSIARSVGGLTEILVSNDDAADGTDSRIRWRAPATGSYIVVAQSLTVEGLGPFVLTVERAPQPTTGAPVVVRPGATVSGTLAETDAVDEEDDTFFDTYLLQGRRGQRLRIDMRSDAFDAFLTFGRDGSRGWEATETNDDGGDGTDARLLVTIPEDGQYQIRATSVGQAAVGPYTLTVSERAAPGEPVARPLSPGMEVSGSLEDGDPETADGALYDLYRFEGTAGQRVSLRLASDRFDTFLVVGRLASGGFHELASNDDAGGGTDSALELTLPGDGVYGVRAQSLAPGGYGPYRLRLDVLR